MDPSALVHIVYCIKYYYQTRPGKLHKFWLEVCEFFFPLRALVLRRDK